jgi:hypothetical protein
MGFDSDFGTNYTEIKYESRIGCAASFEMNASLKRHRSRLHNEDPVGIGITIVPTYEYYSRTSTWLFSGLLHPCITKLKLNGERTAGCSVGAPGKIGSTRVSRVSRVVDITRSSLVQYLVTFLLLLFKFSYCKR